MLQISPQIFKTYFSTTGPIPFCPIELPMGHIAIWEPRLHHHFTTACTFKLYVTKSASTNAEMMWSMQALQHGNLTTISCSKHQFSSNHCKLHINVVSVVHVNHTFSGTIWHSTWHLTYWTTKINVLCSIARVPSLYGKGVWWVVLTDMYLCLLMRTKNA